MQFVDFIDGMLFALIGGIGTTFWYLIKKKDEELLEIKKEVHDIMKTYATKNDMSDRFDRIENKIDKIFDHLYKKQ